MGNIEAKHRGDTTGEMALEFANTGFSARPVSKPGVLVIGCKASSRSGQHKFPNDGFEPPDNSPFVIFKSVKDIQPDLVIAYPDGDVPNLKTLQDINFICEKYKALDGLEGCKHDKVCGLPPWVMCLPGICCLGGCCALSLRSKEKVLQMTMEINDDCKANNVDDWRLCAAAHTSVVENSNLSYGAHDGQKPTQSTSTDTLVWLEVRRGRNN